MHLAIDDTYGPIDAAPSKYVTGARRTYVAVEFPDSQVQEVRNAIRDCLEELPDQLGIAPAEFHFVDIYNRNGVWKQVLAGKNLRIFEFFAEIYRHYRWRVHIQTVDNRTLTDHGIALAGSLDGIDLTKRDGQALLFLLLKLRRSIPSPRERLILRIDEGTGKADAPFAREIFHEWGERYDGRFAASVSEPLLQIADFLAFSINRSTHLQIKPQRTATDLWFLDLVGRMKIQSPDITQTTLPANFSVADIDSIHTKDRREKGVE
ncbi:DUF3800 domain-containing protein [Granulicella sp. WH15]|uniref:DUF3800 domain-containing protein n=1 Tax=Granulicella sp. WH15 TaxID=2602070 RepID=UPI001366FBE6|nr:DUF3800 domain-containing protein [Granulicella sp. WH15]QHN03846.1 DUF3800 domain-containing protein [Granulicella sp. WH15]